MLKKIIAILEQPEEMQLSRLRQELERAQIELKRVFCYEELSLKEKEETIYITDNSTCLEQMYKSGAYVIAYLTAGNRQQNFSQASYAIESMEGLEVSYFQDVYKRFRGEPWDILTTKRCLIREMTVEDVETFYQIYKEPSITKYMDNLYEDKEKERQYTKDYIDKVYGFYGYGLWSVVKKDTGEVIGRAGLSHRPGFEEAELGFVIGVPWQRQGYMYEVCSAILKYAEEQLGMTKVQALTEKENTASRQLCLKLGFLYVEDVTVQQKKYEKYLYNVS